MGFLEILKLLTKLVPLLRQFVDSAEHLFPEGGKGQEKLGIVKGWLEEASKALGFTHASFEAAWPLINIAITGVVKALK